MDFETLNFPVIRASGILRNQSRLAGKREENRGQFRHFFPLEKEKDIFAKRLYERKTDK